MSLNIPVLDISSVSASELFEALARDSCVFLKGHEVDPNLLSQVMDSWDTFAALPVEKKREVQWPGVGPWYGWQPVADAGPQADLLERFELRLDAKHASSDRQAWADTFPAWPDTPDNFRPSWTRMYFALRELANRVMTLIAEELGRADDDLQPWTANQHANLVGIHYHSQESAPQEGRWRAHPHTDIGAITLLWADHAPGGLEVAINSGQTWVPVLIPEDCWLLQVGDLINLWSGNRIPANLHRVANPPVGAPAVPRRALAYFHHPSLDTVVTPPLDDERPAVTAEEYIMMRQEMDLKGEPESVQPN